jgi:hypothetical protein
VPGGSVKNCIIDDRFDRIKEILDLFKNKMLPECSIKSAFQKSGHHFPKVFKKITVTNKHDIILAYLINSMNIKNFMWRF